MVHYISTYKADSGSLMYCGWFMHPNFDCSTTLFADGILPMLRRPPPSPTWTGIINPYRMEAWIGICVMLVVVTVVLGVCARVVLGKKSIDWTLHFLDALHPVCGRNMLVPGFNAAHLRAETRNRLNLYWSLQYEAKNWNVKSGNISAIHCTMK